jgi:hypothetical protein
MTDEEGIYISLPHYFYALREHLQYSANKYMQGQFHVQWKFCPAIVSLKKQYLW